MCFLVNALSSNWKVTAGVLVVGSCRHHRRLYRGASDRFAGLLPDMLGRFSLLGAFDSFSVDHVFDVRGIFAVSLLIALLVFLTVQVVQKRRWN